MKYHYQKTIRIDEPLADKLKSLANKNKRSMNSEIIYIIEEHIGRIEKQTPNNIASQLRTIASAVQGLKTNDK